MPDRDALAGLRQVLAAIEVMIRSGRSDSGRLAELAREARRHSEAIARTPRDDGPPMSPAVREAMREEHPVS